MADDYGDDSGQKILDDLTRFAERMGAAAMIRRADGLHAALEHAKATTTQEKARDDVAPVEYVKPDIHKFRALDDYDGIKKIIEGKFKAHAAGSAVAFALADAYAACLLLLPGPVMGSLAPALVAARGV